MSCESHCDPADLKQEREADYRVLDAAGSHDEIGAYLGARTPLRVLPQRSPDEPDPDFALACLREVNRFHAGLAAEYRAYAQAKELPLDDVLRHVSLNVTRGQVGQCSTVGRRTAAGSVIVGRNYDFRYRQQLRYLVHTSPPGYAANIGTNSGLVGGRYDGVNEHGLFVSLHTVLSDRLPSLRPGIPFHLVVRIALEICTSAREAMDTVRRMPLFHSFNYFMADADEMYVVEGHPDGSQVMGGAMEVLAATNHFRHPDMLKHHGRRPFTCSHTRLSRLLAGASPVDEDSLRVLLSDHVAPVCGHHDGSATLWSAICDPAAPRIAYSQGAPCRNPHQALPWPGTWPRPGA